MDIKPITTDTEYRATLKEVESLMMAGSDTAEGEKLDLMVTHIEAYEVEHFIDGLPPTLPSPAGGEGIKHKERSEVGIGSGIPFPLLSRRAAPGLTGLARQGACREARTRHQGRSP